MQPEAKALDGDKGAQIGGIGPVSAHEIGHGGQLEIEFGGQFVFCRSPGRSTSSSRICLWRELSFPMSTERAARGHVPPEVDNSADACPALVQESGCRRHGQGDNTPGISLKTSHPPAAGSTSRTSQAGVEPAGTSTRLANVRRRSLITGLAGSATRDAVVRLFHGFGFARRLPVAVKRDSGGFGGRVRGRYLSCQHRLGAKPAHRPRAAATVLKMPATGPARCRGIRIS